MNTTNVKTRGEGCTPERAAAIVALLTAEQPFRRVFPGRRPTEPAPTEPEAQATPPPSSRRKPHKLTPEVTSLVLERRDLSPTELAALVRDRFGIVLSTASVYKAWRKPK